MADTLGNALKFEFDIEIGKLKQRLGQIEGQFKSMSNRAVQETKKMDDVMSKVSTAIAGYFTIGAITNLGRQIIAVRSEFEKYQAVLTTSYGSQQKANQALAMLVDFATKTPFQLTELTGAFVKLKNQGFEPTKDELTKLGDLASSTGKGFGQLAEAILDAQVGEFERLKEFGIKAKTVGDKITFTFKEQSTTVDKTAGSIREYITTLGEMQGVQGSMEAISKTLEGRISNLGDAWDKLLNTLGDNEGIKGAVSGLTSIIDSVNELLGSIGKIGESESLTKFQKFLVYLSTFAPGGGDLMKEAIAFDEAINKTAQGKADDYMRRLQNTIADYKNSYKDSEKAIRAAGDYLKDQKISLIEQFGEAVKLGFNKPEATKEQQVVFQTIRKNLIAVDDLIKNPKSLDEMLFGKDGGEATMGILEKLRKELKGAQEEREKATSEAEILANDKEIESIKNLIFYYENLDKMKRQKAPEKVQAKTSQAFEIDEKTGKQFSIADKDAENARRTKERYENLFKDIDSLSRKNLKNRLSDLRAELTKHTDNSKERIDLLQKIFDVEQKLADQIYNNVMDIGDLLQDIMSEVDSNLGKNLKNTVEAAQKMYSAISNIQNKQGSTTNQVTGLVSGIMALTATLRDWRYESLKLKDPLEQQKQEYENIAGWVEATNVRLAQQRKLIEDLNGVKKLDASFALLDQYQQKQKDVMDNLKNLGIQYINDQWEEYIDSNIKAKGINKLGSFLLTGGQAKTETVYDFQTIDSTAMQTVEDYRNLLLEIQKSGGYYMGKQVVESDLQALQTLIAEYDAFIEQNKGLIDQLNQYLTGTTASTIADSISQGFASGKRDAEDFASDFESLMSNAMLQSFKIKALEEPLQIWYDKFVAAQKSDYSMTLDEKNALMDEYNKIINDASVTWSDLQSTMGSSLSNTGSALAGSVSSIQEDTANIIAGQMNGIRLGVLEQTSIMMQGYSQLVLIEYNTRNLIEIRDILRNNSNSSLVAQRANGI